LESNVSNEDIGNLLNINVHRRGSLPRRRFSSENITISFTDNLNISDIQTFTIWCRDFKVFFATLDLPTDVNIPPVVSNMNTQTLFTRGAWII